MLFHCPLDTKIQKRWRNSSDWASPLLHYSLLSACPNKTEQNFPPAFSPLHHYLPQVACHLNVVPRVVIELAIDWLHNGLEGPRPQVNDQRNCTVFQGQVDIISWLAGVQNEPVALPCLEGESDLIAAALDGVLRQVIAKVFGTTESGHVLISCWKKRGNKRTIQQSAKKRFKVVMKFLSNPTALLMFYITIYHGMLMTVQLLL